MSARGLSVLMLSIFLLSGQSTVAETSQRVNGTDTFISGPSALPAVDAAGDVFASGGSYVLKGRVAGTTHAVGFNVEIEAPVDGSLYGAGFSVTMRAPVAQNLTAAGFSLRTSEAATVGGNARLAGATITVDGPVAGSLSATGADITLNAAIGGDVLLAGDKVSFGPGAEIGGKLVYSAPEAVSIPASVIAPERVTFERSEASQVARGARDIWMRRDVSIWQTIARMFVTYLVSLAVLVGLGAVFLALAPKRVERMRSAALARPGLALLRGCLGFSMLAGLVPVLALTLIGVFVVPVVILAIILATLLAYLLGNYTIFLRVFVGFGGDAAAGLLPRLGVLAAGITVMMLLNLVPYLGWLVNFAVVMFGMGGLCETVFSRMSGRLAPRGAEAADATPA